MILNLNGTGIESFAHQNSTPVQTPPMHIMSILLNCGIFPDPSTGSRPLILEAPPSKLTQRLSRVAMTTPAAPQQQSQRPV